MKTAARLDFVPVTAEFAPAVHNLYLKSPTYISLIGSDTPSLTDIQRELDTLRHDSRRQAMLLLQDSQTIGFLDYKVAYPDLHSATISLILIDESFQGHGYGRTAVEQLESLIKGRIEHLYAVVYGSNERAKAFWNNLGFEHLRDSGPTLSWYLKKIS